MVQCAACGKFMGTKEGVSCTQCKSKSHYECVRIPIGAKVADTWQCGECQSKTRKGRDPATPVRGIQDSFSVQVRDEQTLCQPENKKDEIKLLRQEMCSEFNRIQNLMTSEFNASKEDRASFLEEIRELRKELSETRSSINQFNDRMDALDARLAILEKARSSTVKSEQVCLLEQNIADLKIQLNEREQEHLLNDLEITGLPEHKGENPIQLVFLLASKIGTTLEEKDVVMAEREGGSRFQNEVSSSTRSRRIVVRFTRRSTRDAYLQAARVRRGITAADLGIEGPPVRLFVNERLTRINRQIFTKCREECRRQTWKYCWTKDGRIFLRKEQGAPYARIRSENDYNRVFANGSV